MRKFKVNEKKNSQTSNSISKKFSPQAKHKFVNMETKAIVRFTLGKQSSMVLERHDTTVAAAVEETDDVERPIDPEVMLMYLANEGDLDGIRELLDFGVNVNFKDSNGRTALHGGEFDEVMMFEEMRVELELRLYELLLSPQ